MKKPTIEDWGYDGIHIETPSKRYLTQEEQVKAYSDMIGELIKQNNLLYLQLESLEWLRKNKGNIEDIEGWVRNQVELLAWRIKANEETLKKAGCE